MKDLSFHLLVAGELEIITSQKIPQKERDTQLEVLKKLAYKSEFLSTSDIIALYANFLGKIEKGKFKWGCEHSLQAFEQQLVCNVSINNASGSRHAINSVNMGKEDPRKQFKTFASVQERKKYCAEYIRGNCSLDAPIMAS